MPIHGVEIPTADSDADDSQGSQARARIGCSQAPSRQRGGMIFWIASYPKSGNTWLRLLIETLRRADGAPISINAIARGHGHASNRALFDEVMGVRAADLPRELVTQLQPLVYEHAAALAPRTEFWKIHDALHPAALPLIPARATRGVLYVVRNPLDVAVSLRSHLGITQDAAIGFMADENAMLARGVRALQDQLPQCLLSWSSHVASWLNAHDLPLHLLRYEDLQATPLATLRATAAFLELPADEASLKRALEMTAFAALRAQEAREGFRERNRKTPAFFRRGKVGAWREELTESQLQRLVSTHGPMMQALGYLDAAGQLLC